MKILLTGADGQLGKELVETFGEKEYTVFPLSKEELNITNVVQIREVVQRIQPNVIINAAAFTKVDHCEKEVEKAFTINSFGPYYLASEAKKRQIKLFHISTDYVFGGDKLSPYTECDVTSPKTIYGKSKKIGEELSFTVNNDMTIIRTSWLYGHGGENFVNTIKKLADNREEIRVVHDQLGCPTYTKDLGIVIKKLLSASPGIYHVSNAGSCTWFEFATEIIRLLNKSTRIIPISTEEYKVITPRPKNSVLCHEKINKLGIYARHWKEGLYEYIRRELGEST
jgi:dTDP-4-dehydrorhamnose reductase